MNYLCPPEVPKDPARFFHNFGSEFVQCTTIFTLPEFFSVRPGLTIWGAFNRLFKLQPEVCHGSSFRVWYGEVPGLMLESEISEQLPGTFPELWQVAALIERQPYGKEGILRTDVANVIPLKDFGCSVAWSAPYNTWFAGCWPAKPFSWLKGVRAFSVE